MQFNAFVWELYKESKESQKVLDSWSQLSTQKDGPFPASFFGVLEPDPQTPLDEEGASVVRAARDYVRGVEVNSLEDASTVYEKMVRSGLPIVWPDGEADIFDAERIAASIYEVSLGLHLAQPDYFIPYGFTSVFNILERVGETFNLPLPPIPGKRDKEGRALLYSHINEAFQEFRKRYNLSVIEMCAFLYDFALHTTEDYKGELPAPSKVWLITGGTGNNGDFEWLEAADENSTSFWQGNVDTRRGDVLLMYCVSPHSRIHSIWRAMTDGFIDPFFHYHSTIDICNPIKTAPVTFKDMKTDPLLSQKGAIKAHLQGPSGKPFTLEEYEAILDIMAAKGQDISNLPKPQRVSYLPSDKLQNERDVEVELIEPLLERLGYTSDDWLRQMRLRMGRDKHVYPDYAFGAVQKRGEESAAMVLEAKFSISTNKELQEAYFQVRSYALRLQTKVAVLAAREGVWVFPRKRGGFGLEHHTHHTWDDLTHPDVFHELSNLIRP